MWVEVASFRLKSRCERCLLMGIGQRHERRTRTNPSPERARASAPEAADAIEEKLRKIRVKPSHLEGYPHGDWLLLDYVDFVVHLFTPRSRNHYDLERLWGDAARLAVADDDDQKFAAKG